MAVVAAVLQILGLAALAVAGWLVYPPLGVALAAGALLVVGIALERRARAPERRS